MAESASMVNRQLLFDADGDTPVPAAEALVGLKHGLTHIHQHSLSPLRKRKNTNSNHKRSPNQKMFVASRFEDSSDKSTDSDEADCMDSLVYKRRKKESSFGNHYHSTEADSQLWKKPIRTFLRLPKALSWCRYEWFCSDIDRLFLGGESDFSHCVKDMFPDLDTRSLTAVQWRVIRRMIGKPRRCSSVFFSEERMLLAQKRRRVRDIQKKIHQGTLTSTDFDNIGDIPDKIPAVLTVGTKVTTYLDFHKDKGFHTGTVEAVDFENNQYWVRFDQTDIGKFSVPDTDIQCIVSGEYISLSSLRAVHLDRQLVTTGGSGSIQSNQLTFNPVSVTTSKVPLEVPDPLLTSSTVVSRTRPSTSGDQLDDSQQIATDEQSLGGFPTVLLRQVVEMSKLLALKQDRVRRISLLNKEAEKLHARHLPLMQSFQKHYATIVVDLDDINRQLNLRSEAVKKYCTELGYEDEPYYLSNSQECFQHAQEIVATSNERLRASGSEVKCQSVISLVSKLTSLLLQIELLSQGRKSHDVPALQNSIAETMNFIQADNHKEFRKHIEKPLTLIQSGMNPSDNLHPFSVTVPRKPLRTNDASLHSPRRGK